ncbi:MAG: phosphatase PAP2 family protein [Bacillota bacterium]
MLKFFTRRQWILVGYLPIHLLWFFILEAAVTVDYTPIHCALDDLVPFCEWFIFPYFLWFPYMVGTGLYFRFKDDRAFEHFMLMLVIGFFICTLICSVFPNGQDLRPNVYSDNFAAQIIRAAQIFDTNTNVFPSMHVVGALGTAVAIAKSQMLKKKRWLQLGNALFCVLILLATVFLKQHSVLDIFAGVAVFIPVYVLVYTGCAGRLLTKIEKLLFKTSPG